MSDLFESYEQDYTALSASISRKLHAQLPQTSTSASSNSGGGEQRRQILRALERELDEAAEILNSMQMEMNGMSSAQKNGLVGARMRGYKSDYDKLRNEFKRVSSMTDRDLLLSTGANTTSNSGFNEFNSSSSYNGDGGQRDRLVSGTNRLEDASRRLEQSHSLALETEQLAISTLTTLRSQRTQIQRAGEGLDDTNAYLDRAGRVLREMARRAATNRVVSILIIVCLCIAIILLLALKFG